MHGTDVWLIRCINSLEQSIGDDFVIAFTSCAMQLPLTYILSFMFGSRGHNHRLHQVTIFILHLI
jgi:hypothetical protein